jgi:hypothetical protein
MMIKSTWMSKTNEELASHPQYQEMPWYDCKYFSQTLFLIDVSLFHSTTHEDTI